MVKLRLKRCGRKQQAVYRIVAIDVRSRREGKDLKKVGFYDPINNQMCVDFYIMADLVQKGARPTRIVREIIARGIWEYYQGSGYFNVNEKKGEFFYCFGIYHVPMLTLRELFSMVNTAARERVSR